MEVLHLREVLFRASLDVFLEESVSLIVAEVHCVSFSDARENLLLLSLIVHNRTLVTVLVLELLAQQSISCGHCSLCRQEENGVFQNTHTHSHHSRVYDTRVTRWDVLAIASHIRVAVQHVVTRNTNLFVLNHQYHAPIDVPLPD